MASSSKCSIGKKTATECNKTFYVKSIGEIAFSELSDADLLLMKLRTGEENIENICLHHQYYFLNKYSTIWKVCCDPFGCHKKKCRGSLREITLQIYETGKLNNIHLIPGKKLCSNCIKKISEQAKEETTENESSETEEGYDDTDMQVFEDSLTREADKSSLEECFSALGESPIKLHGKPLASKIKLGKRKLISAVESMKKKVAATLNVSAEEIPLDMQNSTTKESESKVTEYDRLLKLMKEKIESSKSVDKKVQVLTLAPESWSIESTSTFFNVSQYAVRKARCLFVEDGILALPSAKRGKSLSDELKKKIVHFYENDEVSRQMPGKKDYVSLKKNVHKQKRLMLMNLNELYSLYKSKNPDDKIGFSKFCQLRPKWCVLTGATGTHSVCVCTYHQNTKLILSPIKADYKELFKHLVCDIDNKECMIHRCDNCPTDTLVLEEKLAELIGEYDDDDFIEYSQWTTTDRANLINHKETVENYIPEVVKQLQKLTRHSFIAKCQSRYLNFLKETMDESTALFLGDFAENYQFVVQDEVQGFHWNNLQCTLHPVVIYFKQGGVLKHKSYCVLSDDNDHDVGMVYQVQKFILDDIKQTLPMIDNVIYFSDGCAAQYKNRKNIFNLCQHQEDFNLKAKWVFFATSHGKQPCDGIGGTVKRLTANASLQRTYSNQIMTPSAMFTFCKENISEIQFEFATKEELINVRQQLSKRFEPLTTIPGTRSFHEFIPIDSNTITTKYCSEDTDIALTFVFSKDKTQVNPLLLIKVFDFVCCIYDNYWWVGTVLQVDDLNDDIEIKFMHPHGPSPSFKWPTVEDTCWVPKVHVLCIITTPTTATGRSYMLLPSDVQVIENLYLSI